MTTCRSSGLPKPTAGCECRYCTGVALHAQVQDRIDSIAAEIETDQIEINGMRNVFDGFAVPINKRWEEALAAKRKQR